MLGASATPPPTGPRLIQSGRYPSQACLAAACGSEGAEDLLATMAGERDGVPPIHGVLTMTTSRVPLLPVDEAKAVADEAGVPDYMAEPASSKCC